MSLLHSVQTFSDYFALNVGTDEVVAELGYRFTVESLPLPRFEGPLDWIPGLRTRLEKLIPHVTFTTETARREFLIAQVLADLAGNMEVQIRPEYALSVGAHLRGTLDYLLVAKSRLLVIEAKQGDLARGFTQLAAELIALDHWENTPGEVLYGGVSLGDAWRFGMLHRTEKRIVQDIHLFTIPDNLTPLCQILVGILTA